MESSLAAAPVPSRSTPHEDAARRTLGQSIRGIVVCSLVITAAAAVVAVAVAAVSDQRWSVAFVIARWLFVAALLATPLLHQLAVRLGIGRPMPWFLSTPATALLLTCESIAFDIASARLGD